MQGGFFPSKKINLFGIWAQIFNATEGRFFKIEFRKKDGTTRILNGRIYEKMNPEKEHKHLIVRDVQVHRRDPSDQGYRKIDPSSIVAFKCGNFQFGQFSSEVWTISPQK